LDAHKTIAHALYASGLALNQWRCWTAFASGGL